MCLTVGDYTFIFFGQAHGVQKFPGQGSNLCCGSDVNCCSDNTRPLTHCTTKELPFLSSFLRFLGPHPWLMEVPRLGVESKLQLLVYTTATATRDPSHVCNLQHSSQQHRILNPLSKARDRACVLMWILVSFVTPEPQWELLHCSVLSATKGKEVRLCKVSTET